MARPVVAAPVVGVLVPPRNPAVVPELSTLLAQACEVVPASLPVIEGDLAARLAGYPASYESAINQLKATHALEAIAIGVTGAAYPAGEAADRLRCDALAAGAMCPVVTASVALVDAMRRLKAKSVTLVSPYPAWLTQQSVTYWQSAGFSVAEVVSLSDTFRAYEMETPELTDALHRMRQPIGDVVVIAGTGLRSLDALHATAERRTAWGVPLLTSNIATAWWLLASLRLPPTPALRSVAPFLVT